MATDGASGTRPVVATDSKEFKRPKMARDDATGELIRDPATGKVTVLNNRGFYTQLGVAVRFRDPASFPSRLQHAFAEVSTRYRVTVPRLFASSRFLLERVHLSNYPKTLSYLHSLVDRIQAEIEEVFVDWLILPRDRIPEVHVGGSGAISTTLPTPEFVSQIGNMWSAISAWDYLRLQQFPDCDLRIDHFQGKLSPAWAELTTRCPTMKVVPWGDEVDPFICAADILAYLTDKTARSRHKRLFRDSVQDMWDGRPFRTKTAYFDEEDLEEIAWTDQRPIRVEELYPRPMTYLQVDASILVPTTPEADEIGYRDYLEAKGFINAVLLSAQLERTGFKVLQPHESALVKDGDRLVYMGAEAAKRSAAINDAVDVRIESVRQLRNRLRDGGHLC